jgi:hypothetical protein
MIYKPGFAAEYAYASFASYYYYGRKACLSFIAKGDECCS